MNKPMVKRFISCAALALVFAAGAMAQSSSFGMAAQGIAMEMVSIARWIGVIIVVLAGIGIAAGEHHTHSKIFGLVFGLCLALFAQPLVTWLQAL